MKQQKIQEEKVIRGVFLGALIVFSLSSSKADAIPVTGSFTAQIAQFGSLDTSGYFGKAGMYVYDGQMISGEFHYDTDAVPQACFGCISGQYHSEYGASWIDFSVIINGHTITTDGWNNYTQYLFASDGSGGYLDYFEVSKRDSTVGQVGEIVLTAFDFTQQMLSSTLPPANLTFWPTGTIDDGVENDFGQFYLRWALYDPQTFEFSADAEIAANLISLEIRTVPEPATALTFAAGLIGLGWIRRKLNRTQLNTSRAPDLVFSAGRWGLVTDN